jgi:hypothetical protein
MRLLKSLLPLLCFVLLFWGCQKADTSVSHPAATADNKVNTVTIYSPEHVVTNSAPFDSTSKVEMDAVNIDFPSTAVYEGYTKTYNCTSNAWTYVYTWTISLSPSFSAPSGNGQLVVGTDSYSSPFSIIGTQDVISRGITTAIIYTIQYTLTVQNDNTYCNATTLQEKITYSYVVPAMFHLPPTTITLNAVNSESADPNVYQTFPDLVGGEFANGDGTYEIECAPGVLVCNTICHVSALGFPPTVYFYYRLVGSSTWSVYSQAGTDLNGFNVQVSQAGTYEYYTQEDTSPGVLSGEINYGTIAVH